MKLVLNKARDLWLSGDVSTAAMAADFVRRAAPGCAAAPNQCDAIAEQVWFGAARAAQPSLACGAAIYPLVATSTWQHLSRVSPAAPASDVRAAKPNWSNQLPPHCHACPALHLGDYDDLPPGQRSGLLR